MMVRNWAESRLLAAARVGVQENFERLLPRSMLAVTSILVVGMNAGPLRGQQSNTKSGADLEYSLRVNPDKVEFEVPDRTFFPTQKFKLNFALHVKNRSDRRYEGSPNATQAVMFEVYEGDDSAGPAVWKWPDENRSTDLETTVVIPADEEREFAADWTFELPAPRETVLTVVAKFLPSGKTVQARVQVSKRAMAPTILFTGKLFGYFRYPDIQRMESHQDYSQHACPDGSNPDEVMSADAEAFMRNRSRNEEAILVGTGDNFAPNYYSRVLVPAAGVAPGRNVRKEMYVWDPWNPNGPAWTRSGEISNTLWKEFWDDRGVTPTDNVACFLSYAHYDAIVPGKHDFYYGPERLRQLARFLAGIRPDGKYQPVQMLGANLVVRTTWTSDHKRVADSMNHELPFDTQYGRVGKGRKLTVEDFRDGDFAYPWLRRVWITFTGWYASEGDNARAKEIAEITAIPVYLCRALKKGDPDSLILPGQRLGQAAQCLRLERPSASAPKPAGEPVVTPENPPDQIKAEYKLPDDVDLEPDWNYGLCLPNPYSPVQNAESRVYCFRFAVYRPFLQSGKMALHPQPSPVQPKNPDLWVCRDVPGLGPVAIFGIVDPNLGELVGGLNFGWSDLKHNPNLQYSNAVSHKQTTQLFVGDPLKALTQVQQLFEVRHPSFKGLKILLAEMPAEKARALAARLPGMPSNLRFDVIISEADDTFASPNGEVVVEPGGSGTKPDNATELQPPTLVLVPPTHQTLRDHLARRFVHIRQLRVSRDPGRRWHYWVSGEPTKVPLPTFDRDPSTAFWLAVCRDIDFHVGMKCRQDKQDGQVYDDFFAPNDPKGHKWDDDVKKSAVQQLALLRIQRESRADFAMLQERDFYEEGLEEFFADHCYHEKLLDSRGYCAGPSLPAKLSSLDPNVEEILDRVLWKGDFSYSVSIQGSVLKTVLAESKAYAASEKSPLNQVDEGGRALVTAGIHYDEGRDEYRINGTALDPASLYTVATSDYVAFGDTGYPELGKPPVGDPPIGLTLDTHLCGISNLVDTNFGEPTHRTCDDRIATKAYFDSLLGHEPSDSRPGNTQAHNLYAWSFLGARLGQPFDRDKDKNHANQDIPTAIERVVQDRNTWLISLSKLAIGFDGLGHSGSEADLKNNFGGIPNSQVTAKHFHSWNTDIESSVQAQGKLFNYFLNETLLYSSKFTSQPTPPRDINQTANQVAFDFGTYVHTEGKKRPQFQWLLGGHFETQPFTPYSSIIINPIGSITASQTLTFIPNKSQLLLGRIGPRWQDRKSYFQIGGEGGANLNAIKQFDILSSPGGPLITSCPLEAEKTLNSCVNNYNKQNPNAPITESDFVKTLSQTRLRFGIFWDSVLNVPLLRSLNLQLKNQGDFVFPTSNDNSTDTRFRHQYTQAVQFYVFPSLDFEPTYSIFLFQNKIERHFLFQQELAIKINFSFNWSSRREWKQQLQYQKPSSQQQ